MTNKFQKSVMERLEQDAQRQKQDKRQGKKAADPEEQAPAALDLPSPGEEIQNTPESTPPDQAPAAENSAPEAGEPQVDTAVFEKEPEVQNPPLEKTRGKTAIKRPAAPSPDLSGYLRREPERRAKNKTFYLDVEVIQALTGAAREQRVTDSKLCNDILRKILGI